jgi:P27 family predicted phage terminase small subunit
MERKQKMYAPRWMARSAQLEFKRVLPMLIERQTFTEADMTTFENYCVCVGVVRDAQKSVDDEGLTKVQKDGRHTMSASLRVQFNAMAQAKQLAVELGLTPLSRSKPKRAEETQSDPDLSDLDL